MTESDTKTLANDLRVMHSHDMVAADKRQQGIAKENQKDHRSIEGLGRPVASFDAAGYMDLKTRQGVGAADKDFMKWVTKRHPEVAVKCTGTKIQAGYSHVPEEYWPFNERRRSGGFVRTKKTY
jgi:hypothetical protein